MINIDVRCDWVVNSGRRRIQIILLLFRIAQRATNGRSKILRKLASALYRVVALNFFSIDMPVHTQIGPRLRIHHGFGLVVNAASKIGSDVELRHGTTIGSRISSSDCPTIGDRVSVGPQTVIMGAITVGADAKVGAGSVLLHNVDPGATVAGSPARALKS